MVYAIPIKQYSWLMKIKEEVSILFEVKNVEMREDVSRKRSAQTWLPRSQGRSNLARKHVMIPDTPGIHIR